MGRVRRESWRDGEFGGREGDREILPLGETVIA